MIIKKRYYINLMKQDFFIEIKLPLIPIKRENMNAIFINKEIWTLLSNIKKEIDTTDIKEWDNVKKITNDYELIYLSSRCREGDSIANIKPLSRSYFKMIEILNECSIPLCDNIKCGHLAEGPGGFIQATVDTLNRHEYKYNCHGITLRSTEKDIPGWSKAKRFLRHNNVKIHYGIDNTGNLYIKNNILHFADTVGPNSCELVTADGGFDFSGDFNKQEEMSYQLLLCEIISNLLIQKKGGYFVIKFFDIFTRLSLQLIYLIGIYYDSFTIMKPKTSRIANSEKYIIFKDYQGCPMKDIDVLLNVIDKTKNYNELSLFQDFETLPFMDLYIDQITLFNKNFSMAQMDSIKQTLEILNNKEKLESVKSTCEKYQVSKALEWCSDYSIPVNFYSSYLK